MLLYNFLFCCLVLVTFQYLPNVGLCVYARVYSALSVLDFGSYVVWSIWLTSKHLAALKIGLLSVPQ